MAAYPVLELLMSLSHIDRRPILPEAPPPPPPVRALIAWPSQPNLFSEEIRVTYTSTVSSYLPLAPSAVASRPSASGSVAYHALNSSIFCSSAPLLSAEECQWVIDLAEQKAHERAMAAGGEGWSTSRHYAVPTTDIAVQEIPELLSWFNQAMVETFGPLLVSQLIQSLSLLSSHRPSHLSQVESSAKGKRSISMSTTHLWSNTTLGWRSRSI
jgi:uncharacterized Zn-finger protein